MSIDDLGLNTPAECRAFIAYVERRLAQAKSLRIVEEFTEHYPQLLGWWDEPDATPGDDVLLWPQAGYFPPQAN